MITTHKYEGKNKEELLKKICEDLNFESTDLFIYENEITGKIFKNKKYELEIITYKDVIFYLKDFIAHLKKSLKLDINSEININENVINIMLVSDNNAILIGKDGKTMKAIQIILKQILQRNIKSDFRLNLDIANYKIKKIKNLEREIKNIAREVLRTKIEVKLDPMNSYERRLVHTVISEFEDLETESEGTEPQRYIKVKYKD